MSPSVMTPASFLSHERITTVVMLWLSNRFSMSEIRTSSKSYHQEKAASVCLMNLYNIAVLKASSCSTSLVSRLPMTA